MAGHLERQYLGAAIDVVAREPRWLAVPCVVIAEHDVELAAAQGCGAVPSGQHQIRIHEKTAASGSGRLFGKIDPGAELPPNRPRAGRKSLERVWHAVVLQHGVLDQRDDAVLGSAPKITRGQEIQLLSIIAVVEYRRREHGDGSAFVS